MSSTQVPHPKDAIMFERFTDSARRTVVLAQEEARMLNHDYTGTEHLLLALLADGSFAGSTLSDLGVTREEARGHVVAIIGEGLTACNKHLSFTPRAKAVLNQSFRTSLELGHKHIGTEHLLIGLAQDAKSVAGQVLFRCGLAVVTVRDHVAALMSEAPEPEPGRRFALSA
jgi:ATP-dependent Clp protease ATP-binding subunit ClpC